MFDKSDKTFYLTDVNFFYKKILYFKMPNRPEGLIATGMAIFKHLENKNMLQDLRGYSPAKIVKRVQ